MGYLTSCQDGSAVSTCGNCKKVSPEPRKVKVFNLQELARATNSFSTANLLGKGSHACVYKAVLDDGQVVAVKRPTIGRRNLQDTTSFNNELQMLSTLQDRHLVNLIGYCIESSEKLLVVEYMDNGSLWDLLHSSSEPLSWPLRVHMAYQVAKAVHALHSASPPIIHRDVKSSNILVDSDWNAKLGDLGLALRGRLEDVVRQKAPPAGTMGYIDPAYETPSQLSAKSDVFSFGILLLEIMSGRNAIDVRFNPSSIIDWAVPLIRRGKSLSLCDPALRPPQNSKAVKQLAAIAARSVRLSSTRRPTMEEVVEGLRRIRRQLPIPIFGGKPARTTISSLPAIKGEVSEDFSECGLSGRSETLSVFDAGSVEGSVSPTDSVKSSQSLIPVRKRLAILTDSSSRIDRIDHQKCSFPTQATRKIERPLLDPNSWSTSSCYSPTRIDMIHSLTGSPMSPSMPVIDSDRSSRRSLESPTFGSKVPVRTLEPIVGVAEETTAGLSTQHGNSRVKSNDWTTLQRNFSSQRDLHLRTLRETMSQEESLTSGHLPTIETNRGLKGRRGVDLSGGQKPMYENVTTTRDSVSGEASDVDVDSNGRSTSQPARYARDFTPAWGARASTRKLYTNAQSQFDKVDLPIAV